MPYVLVVHPERALRDRIASALDSVASQVVTAKNALAMFEYVSMQAPTVLVVGDTLEGIDVYEIMRQMRESKRFSETMLMLVYEQDDLSVDATVLALDAGADDCISTARADAELAARVGALIRRGRFASPSRGDALSFGPLQMVAGQPCVRINGRAVWLTETEYRLLEYLVQAAGDVVAVSELMEEVWELPPESENTVLVRAYIRNLRKKIEVEPSQPEYIRTVRGRGYRLHVPFQIPS